MKNIFFKLLFSAAFTVQFINGYAVSPDPLVVSRGEGNGANVPSLSGNSAAVSYIQNPTVAANDTVLVFTRKAGSNTYSGVRYGLRDDKSGEGLNGGNGVMIGGRAAEQYRYLVVKAKLSTLYPFMISLKYAVGDPSDKNSKTNDIASLNAPIINEWVDYVFDLSQAGGAQGTGKAYLSLLLTPERSIEKSKTETTSYINELYFTNTISAASLRTMKPTITTIARTAKSVDLVWNALPNVKSYQVVDADGKVLVSNVAKTQTSIENLQPNKSYSFRVIALSEGVQTPASEPQTVTTRATLKKGEMIENFENPSYTWTTNGICKIVCPVDNPTKVKENPSAKCAQVLIEANKENYCGLKTIYEKIQTGPDAPFQYLHVKMKRNADVGAFSLTLLERKDIKQSSNSPSVLIPFSEKMVDGNWNEYLFDLRSATKENQVHYGFYLRPNRCDDKTQLATESYIDEIYVTNE